MRDAQSARGVSRAGDKDLSDNSQGKQCLVKASSNGNPERGLVLSVENVFFQLVSHFVHAMFLRAESNDFAHALN